MPGPTGHEDDLVKKLLVRMTTPERDHLDLLAREWKFSVNAAVRELIQKSMQQRRYDEAMAAKKKRDEERARTRPPAPPATPTPARTSTRPPTPPQKRAPTAPAFTVADVFREPEPLDGQTSILDDDQ